ncbi:MAG: undecaprenyl-phosphate glucose phosphotransferase [Acidobacteriota bacterium]
MRTTSALFVVSDIVAIVLAFFAAWLLRFQWQVVPLEGDAPALGPYLHLLPVIVLVWPLVYYFHGLYQIRRGQSRIEEFSTLVVAQLLTTLLLAGFTAFYRPVLDPETAVLEGGVPFFTYSRAFMALFGACAIIAVTLGRLQLRAVLRWRRLRGHNIRRILVVGAGKVGREVAQRLVGHREYGFDVIGFADDNPALADKQFSGVPILGQLRDVTQLIQDENVDQVMIALPLEAHRKILRILDRVENECVEVRLVPSIYQYAALRAGLEDLDGIPILNLSQMPLAGWQSMGKRFMDLAVSAILMLLLLPVLPLVALAIWLEDRGPIFYKQERMGLDGRSFYILKLRSMRVNAEASTGPIWAIEDDPRRTRIGSFLRRTSIDELPQLWNVFKGEMSIVGPRPERPAFVDEFKHKIPNYMLRHRVKSGITGWAQVHGWRGNTSIRKRIQYDLYYIENWSLRLDVKILWMTLRQGWLKNAY